MYFLIGADLVPTKSNQDRFIKGDAKTLVGEEILTLLEGSSQNIFNLEVPLTDQEKPIVKQGPNLIAPCACVKGYQALRTNLLTLSNNHILDQDELGLQSTIKTLDEAGIAHLGAGETTEKAKKPAFFEFAGKKIGVYAVCEHEFSVIEEGRSGANPFDPLYSPDEVEDLKRQADYVIVLYHGGKEHYRYPSPNLQKVCHRLVEKGADLVLCQHSHCIGCEETYLQGTIVYGQGNFLFDAEDADPTFWNTSLLVKVDEQLKVSYVPLVKAVGGVRLAKGEEGDAILQGFQERSKAILEKGFLEKEYQAFATSFVPMYLRALSGKRSLIFRILNKLSWRGYEKLYFRKAYDQKALVRIENYFECEAHRELLVSGIKQKGRMKL